MNSNMIGRVECGYFTKLSCKIYYKLDILTNTFFTSELQFCIFLSFYFVSFFTFQMALKIDFNVSPSGYFTPFVYIFLYRANSRLCFLFVYLFVFVIFCLNRIWYMLDSFPISFIRIKNEYDTCWIRCRYLSFT